MGYKVILGAESEHDLDKIYEYIVEQGFPENALRFTESIVRFCKTLGLAPNRGTQHFDVLPGLRILGFHNSVEVIFQVKDEVREVHVARILHGGEDVERVLNELR